jgi:hypothetical protein
VRDHEVVAEQLDGMQELADRSAHDRGLAGGLNVPPRTSSRSGWNGDR